MEGLTPKQRNHIQAMQCPWGGGLVVLIFLTYSHKKKKAFRSPAGIWKRDTLSKTKNTP